MEITIQQATNAHQEGKLDEAERFYRTILKAQPNHLEANNNLGLLLENSGKLKEAEKYFRKAIELKPDLAETHNNLSNTLYKLNKFEEALDSCRKAIELKPDFAKAHNGLGSALLKLNRIEEAEASYKKAVEIKPNYAEAYNNWGVSLNECGRLEEAIEKYAQALTLNPKQKNAKKNMVSILNYIEPNKINTHPIIVANRNLKDVKNNFSLEKEIKTNELGIFFKDCNKILQDSNEELTTNLSQIHRRNKINLGCTRHKQIFKELNIVAKACFSCFKIQIEPKNVLELFKLFFIFDKLVLPKNNSRKCMVETRQEVSGTYKGLIYCSSLEETNEILEIISPVISKLIQYKIDIKRGCIEYTDSFPDYEETNKDAPNFMKYNDDWLTVEKNFDITKNIRLKNNNNSLGGISVSDVLIMNNWLNYARIIGDQSYKNIDEKAIYFNRVSFEVLEKQLVKRKKEFLHGLDFFK